MYLEAVGPVKQLADVTITLAKRALGIPPVPLVPCPGSHTNCAPQARAPGWVILTLAPPGLTLPSPPSPAAPAPEDPAFLPPCHFCPWQSQALVCTSRAPSLLLSPAPSTEHAPEESPGLTNGGVLSPARSHLLHPYHPSPCLLSSHNSLCSCNLSVPAKGFGNFLSFTVRSG